MTDETDNDYTVPVSMRLTRAQRLQLDKDAGSLTVGEYVRSCLFHQRPPLKRNFRRPVQDEQSLTRLTGILSRTRIAPNLNQIARATHQGALIVTPETEQALITACGDIAAMRQELLVALGREP